MDNNKHQQQEKLYKDLYELQDMLNKCFDKVHEMHKSINRLEGNVKVGMEYDNKGLNRYGFDSEGYDKDGFDRFGCDRFGCNRDGMVDNTIRPY